MNQYINEYLEGVEYNNTIKIISLEEEFDLIILDDKFFNTWIKELDKKYNSHFQQLKDNHKDDIETLYKSGKYKWIVVKYNKDYTSNDAYTTNELIDFYNWKGLYNCKFREADGDFTYYNLLCKKDTFRFSSMAARYIKEHPNLEEKRILEISKLINEKDIKTLEIRGIIYGSSFSI